MNLNKLRQTIYGAYLYPYLIADKHLATGTNIFEREWDAVIVLDACRVDALMEVRHEYAFLEEVDTRWSVGSTSKEWIINTFKEEYRNEIAETALVTGNGWAEKVLMNTPEWGRWTALNGSFWEEHAIASYVERDLVSSSDFATFLPTWSNEFSEAGNRAPRAEYVTDAAITTARENRPDRLIVHYMQPHEPYYSTVPADEPLPESNRAPLETLRNGGDKEAVWHEYIENLRYVLDNVQTLLTNIDAEKVIITADHGELFGEMGVYGHVAALPHPKLRKVPWVETQATDEDTHSPDVDIDEVYSPETGVEDRLRNLGYL